ncbi:MAG: exodeoxyribonuclease VII small subunit [Campylobacteraceae bacterium]|jgi:exodeoxyribonuclease VII small subunit|nr:exodeoxyribonuclease VII small subunit [Campylobacteraceae bacterium]MBT3881672.1 exodeoxyribonuclease VII small subunit [Campylobacteraceae bacterium]MBT4178644.1 exodeoxyribonuclease VII small subunit [Campylobacteraceae bacterium]MBT4572521.1 exodeoxyribonuclease VII small subunit [Campylobacteraceae bacterium]MBT4708098.1 exodeoxyribonuclease VII small subunit [Campylobacteraceae bacterium]
MNEEKDINFENKIKSAKNILDKLIDPEITLQKSVNIYKDGMKELEEAQKLLDDAKFKYEEYVK